MRTRTEANSNEDSTSFGVPERERERDTHTHTMSQEGGMSNGGPRVSDYSNLKSSSVNPRFLHSNSTSHRWCFGAIAELIDNAMDPDTNAKRVIIDLKVIKNKLCFVIFDNGNGMSPEQLHKMLGFGHSEKEGKKGENGREYIGRYGNGFKSGSMRIGKDALVITRNKTTFSAGLLSQSFLADIEAEDVYVPMISWDREGNLLNKDESLVQEGLDAIRKYSIYDDEAEIVSEVVALSDTGTMIIISNLKMVGDHFELYAEDNDIRIRNFNLEDETTNKTNFQQLRTGQGSSVDVPLDYSLRAYVSVLYKIPRMQIFIGEKKVHSKRVTGGLAERMQDTYKPKDADANQPGAQILIGFSSEDDNLYGMMMYQNNRLVKPYLRVGVQMEANTKGLGVIGVVDADFLRPMHNKQDFEDTKEYRGLINKLSQNVNMFWWDKVEKPEKEEAERARKEGSRAKARQVHKRKKVPDILWAQCEHPLCQKWRIMPTGTELSKLPSPWYCHMHPDERIATSNHEWPEDSWQQDIAASEQAAKKRKEWAAEKKAKASEKKNDILMKKLQEQELLRAAQAQARMQASPGVPSTSGSPSVTATTKSLHVEISKLEGQQDLSEPEKVRLSGLRDKLKRFNAFSPPNASKSTANGQPPPATDEPSQATVDVDLTVDAVGAQQMPDNSVSMAHAQANAIAMSKALEIKRELHQESMQAGDAQPPAQASNGAGTSQHRGWQYVPNKGSFVSKDIADLGRSILAGSLNRAQGEGPASAPTASAPSASAPTAAATQQGNGIDNGVAKFFYPRQEKSAEETAQVLQANIRFCLHMLFHVSMKTGMLQNQSVDLMKSIQDTLEAPNENLTWVNVEAFGKAIGLDLDP